MVDNRVKTARRNQMKKGVIKKKSHTGLVVLLIILLFVASAVVGYFLNIAGLKDATSKIFANKQQQQTQEEVNEDNQTLFKLQQAKVEQRNKELEQKEIELDTRSSELLLREQAVQELQAEVDKLKEELQVQKKDIESIAKIYNNMDASSAAQVLMKYPSIEEVSNIIMRLSDSKSAEILQEMTPDFASKLLRIPN